MTLKKTPMDDTQKLLTKATKIYPWVEKAVFIFVGAVGLIITWRIAPVVKSVDELTHRVAAVESASASLQTDIKEHLASSDIKLDKIIDNLNSVNGRLNRIEGRLEK